MTTRLVVGLVLMLALHGCSRSKFVEAAQAVQNGSQNFYLAAEARREGDAMPSDMGTIRRPPPAPVVVEGPKIEEPPAPSQQQYIYVIPAR